jgi:hypothetical protein
MYVMQGILDSLKPLLELLKALLEVNNALMGGTQQLAAKFLTMNTASLLAEMYGWFRGENNLRDQNAVKDSNRPDLQRDFNDFLDAPFGADKVDVLQAKKAGIRVKNIN